MNTEDLKRILSSAPVGSACCRKAEAAAMLRLSGGPARIGGRIVAEARLGASVAVADRLCSHIIEAYDHRPIASITSTQIVLRVVRDGDVFMRKAGLLDRHGQPLHGLPRQVVAGGKCDTVAALRGVLLARGSLTKARASFSIEIPCPSAEVASALVALIGRVGVTARARGGAGGHRVLIRDSASIFRLVGLLASAEDQSEVLAWHERRQEASTTGRKRPFEQANRARARTAAASAVASIRRVVEAPGIEVPAQLRTVGQLRLDHPEASLVELGRLHAPELTKDAVAGRLRRLLALDSGPDCTGDASTTTAEGETA